jgi:hypothetical protein
MAKASQPKQNTKSLQELIEEAAKRQLELLELEKQDGQLTPAAYVEDALSVPGASKADAERLLVEVCKPENSALLSTFRRSMKAVRTYPRTRAPRHHKYLFDEAADAHTARLRVSRASLIAAATMAVAKESPEIFGPQTKAGAYDERVKTLVAEKQALFDLIQTSWQRSDVTEHPLTDDARRFGLCSLSLDCCGGEIFVGPDLGLRAVTWWLNDQLRKAA